MQKRFRHGQYGRGSPPSQYCAVHYTFTDFSLFAKTVSLQKRSSESHRFRSPLGEWSAVEWASFSFNMHFLVFFVGVFARNTVDAFPQSIDDLFQDFSIGGSAIGDGDLSKQRRISEECNIEFSSDDASPNPVYPIQKEKNLIIIIRNPSNDNNFLSKLSSPLPRNSKHRILPKQ